MAAVADCLREIGQCLRLQNALTAVHTPLQVHLQEFGNIVGIAKQARVARYAPLHRRHLIVNSAYQQLISEVRILLGGGAVRVC